MNVILIQIDSLNRHFLRTYADSPYRTPNLDAFARRAVIFDQHYVGSLPCMPARREIWAGTEEFWWRNWGPLEPWDKPIAYMAGRSGAVTQLVTDHYHFFEWGSHNYEYDFAGYTFIRGHEHDNYRTDPVRQIPAWAQVMIERMGEAAMIYVQNVQDFRTEEDFFAPKTFSAAAEWLDRNYRSHVTAQFYLHIDSFDVHEPFHIPEPYRSMYTDDDYRRFSPWPIYGRVDAGKSALSPDELAWVRAQFGGKLTMVDTWLGRVFERLDRYDLWDDTAVIITTDHGHYLGEHGWIGKPIAPMYHTLCHIPLMVWFPGAAHRRVSAITQTIDLYATVLDLLDAGVPQSENIHSRSILPLLTGRTESHRDYAVYGYNGQSIGITANGYTLLRDHDPKFPAYWYTLQPDHLRSRSFWRRKERTFDYTELEAGYTLPGVAANVLRMPMKFSLPADLPRPDLLFHTADDPLQERPITDPTITRRLEDTLRDHMRRIGAPDEQFARLRL